jgi:hypothetical protein
MSNRFWTGQALQRDRGSRTSCFGAAGYLLWMLAAGSSVANASAIYGVTATVQVSSGNGLTTYPTQTVNFTNGGNPVAVTSYTSPVLSASGSYTFGGSTVSGSATTWASSNGESLHGYSTAAMSGVCQTCVSSTENGGLFQVVWYDTIDITGLPAGTPVELLLTDLLNSTTSLSGNAHTSIQSYLSLGSQYTQIYNNSGASDGLITQSFLVQTVAGAQLQLEEELFASSLIIDNSNAFPSSSATMDASDTSDAFINVLTPGASYTTASGTTYASIPEPAGLCLAAAGLLVIWAARRRSCF